MKDLHQIPFDKNFKLVSLDITSMYSTEPTKNLTEMVKFVCNQNDINKELRHEIKFREVLIKNCFQYKDIQYDKKMA
jgi:hypothetical protein